MPLLVVGLGFGGRIPKVQLPVRSTKLQGAGSGLAKEERSELIIQIENEAVPEDVKELVAEQAPNLEDLSREA